VDAFAFLRVPRTRLPVCVFALALETVKLRLSRWHPVSKIQAVTLCTGSLCHQHPHGTVAVFVVDFDSNADATQRHAFPLLMCIHMKNCLASQAKVLVLDVVSPVVKKVCMASQVCPRSRRSTSFELLLLAFGHQHCLDVFKGSQDSAYYRVTIRANGTQIPNRIAIRGQLGYENTAMK